MEKRHYIDLSFRIENINNLQRVFNNNKEVIKIKINNDPEITIDDKYKLEIDIFTNEPDNWKGVVVQKGSNELWTKDGLYLHCDSNNRCYIKDFFEEIPGDFQGIYFNSLFDSNGYVQNSIIEKIAEDIIENTVAPKEFYVLSDGKGIEENVVAIIKVNYNETYYYVDSNNEYYPHILDNNDKIYTDWKIEQEDYYRLINKEPNGDGETPETIYGRIKNMFLRSDKLLYLFEIEGTDIGSSERYFSGNGVLLYLNNIVINSKTYQIYLNPLYIYQSSGEIKQSVNESHQILRIDDAFSHDDLKGKTVKVW